MNQMGSNDAIWLYIEPPGESAHVTLVSVYEPGELPPLTRQELEAHLHDRLVSGVPVFSRRLRQLPFHADFPYWVDDPHLDLGRHVRERSLAGPGSWNALLATAMEIHAEPLDKRHPLWDFTLVTGLNRARGLPKGSFAVVSRFHHAMVDGKSLLEVIHLLHDLSPQSAPPAQPTRAQTAADGPSLATIAVRAAVHTIANPTDMLTRVARRLPLLGRQLVNRQARITLPQTRAPRTRFNGPVTADRRLGFAQFDLDRLRALRSAVPGSTLNDVALTIIGGALRDYLDKLAELPEESLMTACPISIRTDQPGQPTLGNQISAMIVPLRTDVADPVERLAAVAEATRTAKEREGAISAQLMTDIQANLTAAASAAVARLVLLAAQRVVVVNTIVSNVPGPQQPIYLRGRRLRMNLPAVTLVDGMGLVHGVTSYNGELVIGFTVDAAAVPDPKSYERCLHAAVVELESAAGATE
jgi:WS/DGAT/MGAT family acyltransferase